MNVLVLIFLALIRDLARILFRPRAEIIAENLFLRRQLALYQERKARRRRPTPAAKLALVMLSRFFAWPGALAIVRPSTFVRWHRAGFRLFWRWKSRRLGRAPLPRNLRILILNMARENPSWGEGRIADELSLKLGVLVDSRTVGKYMKQSGRPRPPAGQRWSTFVRNHAHAIVACDFFTSVNRDWNTPHVARERDGPSHRGVDAAAVPSLPRWRIRASLFNPRSRHCFLGRGRRGTERLRSESIEDSSSKSNGEGLCFTLHLIGTIRCD